jgi:hypothetical protein
MSNYFNWTLIVLITVLSCQKDFELNQIINQSSPIILTQRDKKVESGLFKVDTLKIKSEKWNQFIHFAINDHGNWKSTPVSYNSDFYIQQDDYTLLGWNGGNFVVINYTDKNGKIEQLKKEINKGELNFLTE